MLFAARTSLVVLLSLFVCAVSIAQQTETAPPKEKAQKQEIDPAKKADIKKMLKLTGAGDMAKQMMGQMIGMQRQANPNVPADFWDEFMGEVNADELIDITVPSYDKHFTHEEIKALIQFYESPIGKKLVSQQPKVMQDSMVAGQKWGMKLASKIAMRLKDEGYTP